MRILLIRPYFRIRKLKKNIPTVITAKTGEITNEPTTLKAVA